MQSYKTAEEKAVEWNVSSRHVQYLCRTGKVEGAIKRAGSWFIPDDAPIPTKNTKANSKSFKFIGTKEKIFSCAIELFMLKGFNGVSLRDIADQVGIRQSTIYNHFKSKQEILNAIYDYYCYYFLKSRPCLQDMESVLRHQSLKGIIERIRYDFEVDCTQKMLDISKIIFQRVPIDERARDIGKSLIVDSGIKYVEDVFNMGIKNGRFAAFDTHAFAVFINSVRIFTLYNWIVNPTLDAMAKLREDEARLYHYATILLPDMHSKAEKVRSKKNKAVF